jgi:hypothetical protein
MELGQWWKDIVILTRHFRIFCPRHLPGELFLEKKGLSDKS